MCQLSILTTKVGQGSCQEIPHKKCVFMVYVQIAPSVKWLISSILPMEILTITLIKIIFGMVQSESIISHQVLCIAYIIIKIALALPKLWVISVWYHLYNHTLGYVWFINRDQKYFGIFGM